MDELWADEEYLRDSGDGWYQLDQKLAGALLLILPAALKRKVKTAQKKGDEHSSPTTERPADLVQDLPVLANQLDLHELL